MSSPRRWVAVFVAGCMSFGGLQQAAQAVPLIGAEQVLASAQAANVGQAQARLLALLARDDVAEALAQRGVDVQMARERVAALTDAEAAQLVADLDHAPAGGSELLGTVVLVFVLLVFSDIFGFTRIFPFLRPAR